MGTANSGVPAKMIFMIFVSVTRDSTATFEIYMRGLFQSERANLLRMSDVNAVDDQSMQHMLTEGSVDWDGFGRQIALEANDLLGGSDAVLIFDESDFAKKGEASVGVAGQWNGRLSKVDNCQAGVFASLCRGELAFLIEPGCICQRLVATMRHAAKNRDTEKSDAVSQQLAYQMLEVARQRGVQFGYVGIDGGYGKEPACLRGLDEKGCRFMAGVHCDQAIYLQHPKPRLPDSTSDRG